MGNNSLYNTLIGFDAIFSGLHDNSVEKYPPYNIYKEDSETGRTTLEIALAGFKREDIKITVDDNNLIIESVKDNKEELINYAYRGISKRYFKRQFKLAEHQVVKDAEMINGLLTIMIVREIPEEMRPKIIEIK